MSTRSIHSRVRTPPPDDFLSEKESRIDLDKVSNLDKAIGITCTKVAGSDLQQVLSIYALIATFPASIKVALMSLSRDMLEEGELELPWVYQVWVLGFGADIFVAYLSIYDGVSIALGQNTWVRRQGKTMVAVLSVICFESYITTMVLVGVICGHAGVLPSESAPLLAISYFTVLVVWAICPLIYWIRGRSKKKSTESNV